MTFSGYIFLFILILLPYLVSKTKLFEKHSVAFISAFIIYILIVCYAFYMNYKFEIELDAFDLNGDGSFSYEEQIPGFDKAMDNFVSDTGRGLAPFTGAIFSFLYYIIISIIIYLVNYILKWKKSK